MNNRRLAGDAMLIAIYCVLSILTPIKIVNFKLTFEAFPILVSAILLSPIDGFIVGSVGSLIYQLFFSGYGISTTTILWIIPHSISGLIVGIYAKNKNNDLNFKQISFISIVSSLIVTSLNSLALFADAKIYGYYYEGLILGNIIIKFITGIILGFIYSILIPKLIGLFKGRV